MSQKSEMYGGTRYFLLSSNNCMYTVIFLNYVEFFNKKLLGPFVRKLAGYGDLTYRGMLIHA